MTPPLTPIPATLPGVVRRCTPLVTVEPVFVGCVACAAGMQCTTGAAADSAGRVRAICAFGSISLPIACLALDLTDATGRAHGAGALLGAPVATWTCDRTGEGSWTPSTGADYRCYPRDFYPFLSDLDPYTGYLLPDGSRWVDAEALARVLLHVLGGAP